MLLFFSFLISIRKWSVRQKWLEIRTCLLIRKFLDFDACNNAVRALGMSKLDYCCAIFNGISKFDLHRLQKIQNRGARLMSNLSVPTSPLLRDLHWLPVADRIKFRTLVQTYKILTSSSPQYLASLLKTKENPFSTAAGNQLYILRSHRLACDQAFSIIAPRLWNALVCLILWCIIDRMHRPLQASHNWCLCLTIQVTI